MKKLTTLSKSLSLHSYILRLNPFSLLFVLFSLFTFKASAQTIKYVTPAGIGTKDGSSWANAAPGKQLQTLINGVQSGTQLWVAAGIYTPTINPVNNMAGVSRNNTFLLKDGVALYGGFKGTGIGTPETITGRDITTNSTILSGDLDNDGDISDNAYHVVLAIGCSSSTILDGFIVEKGNADDNASSMILSATIGNNNGSGMYNYSSSPLISNTIFRNNKTVGSGGGVYNYISSPTIINSIFYGNNINSIGNPGAGLANLAPMAGGISLLPPVKIINCTFADNIYNNYFNATIINTIVYSNFSSQIVNGTTNNVTVTNSLVKGGYAGGANIIDADPLFLNPSAGDFSLQAGSPAINAGDKTKVPAYLTTDLAGKSRITGSNVDIGVYETSVVYGLVNAYEQVTNILSPNGDGINDLWKIDDLNIYPDNEVKIFGSNGVLLRSYKNYQNDWDGTLNGGRLKEDTYYYVISVPSGKEVTKGFITIVY